MEPLYYGEPVYQSSASTLSADPSQLIEDNTTLAGLLIVCLATTAIVTAIFASMLF